MSIPIQNIYYLLSYAWDQLDEKDRVKVDIDDKTELLDLFAKILINATNILLKRGIDKNYINVKEELSGIKGKLDISETLKRQLLFKQRTICSFDEFSHNILSNQILVSTIYRLSRTKNLAKNLKNDLIVLQKMLGNIDHIEIKSSLFKQVKIHRNNRFYGFVMNVCQLIYESTLPAENSGFYTFKDFTKDHHKMNRLFEGFIRNFYRKEQLVYKTVKKEKIKWQFTSTNESDIEYLPGMETDISLENESKKIIIDAKFYKDTLTTFYEKERLHSSNLYQLFSYLLNQQLSDSKTTCATGILIYPTILEEYNLSFKYHNHDIYVKTVNLNQNWAEIYKRLHQIIEI